MDFLVRPATPKTDQEVRLTGVLSQGSQSLTVGFTSDALPGLQALKPLLLGGTAAQIDRLDLPGVGAAPGSVLLRDLQ